VEGVKRFTRIVRTPGGWAAGKVVVMHGPSEYNQDSKAKNDAISSETHPGAIAKKYPGSGVEAQARREHVGDPDYLAF